ncbi:MAG: DUF3822 family protein, partial [Chitinophagaceae bacterium]
YINSENVAKKDKFHYVEFNDLGYKMIVLGSFLDSKILSSTEVFWEKEKEAEKINILSKQMKEQNGGYFIINTAYFSLIPDSFFSEKLLREYLFIHKNNFDTKKFIPYCDAWKKEKLFLTYAMPNYLLDILSNTPNTQVYHRFTSLNYIICKKQLAQGKTIFLYIQKDQFLLLAMDNYHLLFAEEYQYIESTDVVYKILSLRSFLQWEDMNVNCYVLFFDKINKEFADLLLSYKFTLIVPNPEYIAQSFGLSFKENPELYNFFILFFLATCEL